MGENKMNDDENKYASPEALRYAKVLSFGVKLGFVTLVVTFLLYVTGILEPLIPVDQLPKYWGLSVSDYVKATGTPTGWGWVTGLDKGDMLNLLGIVVLVIASLCMVTSRIGVFRILNSQH